MLKENIQQDVLQLIRQAMVGEHINHESFQCLVNSYLSCLYTELQVTPPENCNQEIFNWINNHISGLHAPEEFFYWVPQVALIHILNVQHNNVFLEHIHIRDNVTPYTYASLFQDTDKFIPEEFGSRPKEQSSISLLMQSLTLEERMLCQFFFYCNMTITDIVSLTHCNEENVRTALGNIKNNLQEQMLSLQLSPADTLYTLCEKNILFENMMNCFQQSYSSNMAKISSKPTSVTMDTIAPHNPDIVPKRTYQAASYKMDSSKEKEKKTKKKCASNKSNSKSNHMPNTKNSKNPSNSKHIVQICSMIACCLLIMVFLIIFIVRVVLVVTKQTPIATTKDAILQEEAIENAKKEEINEAYGKQEGNVTINFSFSDNTPPTSGDDLLSGTTYNLDMDVHFLDDEGYEDAGRSSKISLIYTDITEQLNETDYLTRKENIQSGSSASSYTFDDTTHSFHQFQDWEESDSNTAIDYNHDALVSSWKDILDNCKDTIQESGDGCDLSTLMPENATLTIDGITYQLVFSSANGFSIIDEAADETMGSSENYILDCYAYLLPQNDVAVNQ